MSACGNSSSLRGAALNIPRLVFPLLLMAISPRASADGCFVFKWNKDIDIKEPTQKAIIVYQDQREDLLLQVKYEGRLEDFGWLIPVPALPKVEKGEMAPFYELSELTQRQFGGWVATASSRQGTGGESDSVKVIEIKTVGAYDVAILSANDAGSLETWLKSNGFSVPPDRQGILDDYLRNGWYFVAARIHLNRGTGFNLVPSNSNRGNQEQAKPAEAIQKELANGELHPLRISFETPRCIFPLRISAVNGQPSEVSLYVLADQPLLNKLVFEKRLAKVRQEKAESDSHAKQRGDNGRTAMLNNRRLSLAWRMYTLMPAAEPGSRRVKDWNMEDLDAMAAEDERPAPMPEFDDGYYPSAHELLQTMLVAPTNLVKSAKVLERLAGKSWHLTRLTYTFRPDEMEDLEFEPAVPVLAALLPLPEGRAVAGALYQCGSAAVPAVLSACGSINATERINASSALQSLKSDQAPETLLVLLKDPVPEVRLNAATGTAANWDPRFFDALFGLLRDPHPRVALHAAQNLSFRETRDRAPLYLELLRDPDPELSARALRVLAKIDPEGIPRADLLGLLGQPRMDLVSQSLGLLRDQASLASPPTAVPPGFNQGPPMPGISSREAAPLTTNRLILARLTGLSILSRHGDADAIALALPMLRDTNSIVRNRAFTLVRSRTRQNFPQDDPAKWEAWWKENRLAFEPR